MHLIYDLDIRSVKLYVMFKLFFSIVVVSFLVFLVSSFEMVFEDEDDLLQQEGE
ncbi:MAG: hypothetical protein K2Q03_09480 [Sphingobacteriaceae bacterium]|nr:hypothetical protein [Sphingobacteriaceae bacterium]